MMVYLTEIVIYLSKGALISISVFLITLLFAFPLAMILSMLQKSSQFINKIIAIYTWLFRGTPLMLQLFLFMYGLPFIGINVNRMTVAFIGFIINYTAYFIEIIRAGIESVPQDQIESAAVMGANKFTIYRYIVLPQAIRIQIPVITNEIITLIKDTALVTVIAISDLMRNVKEIVSRDFTISPFILASAFYLIISFFIVKLFKFIEYKYNY